MNRAEKFRTNLLFVLQCSLEHSASSLKFYDFSIPVARRNTKPQCFIQNSVGFNELPYGPVYNIQPCITSINKWFLKRGVTYLSLLQKQKNYINEAAF